MITPVLALNNPDSLFRNQEVLLVSRHGKEVVLAPVLQEAFGMRLTVATTVNTDDFGTFSGEISRPATQYQTALLKLEAGFNNYPTYTWALASEGAFVPHPQVPLLTINYELLVLRHQVSGLEISSQSVSTDTNLDARVITSLHEAQKFALQAGFPAHGLIMRPHAPFEGMAPVYIKGIASQTALSEAFANCRTLSADGRVYLETDMRAMQNPTRMENIKQAARELVKNMQRTCPNCATPGFAKSQTITGLPCEWCRQPTHQVLADVYACRACQHTANQLYPAGAEYAAAGTCSFCNP